MSYLTGKKLLNLPPPDAKWLGPTSEGLKNNWATEDGDSGIKVPDKKGIKTAFLDTFVLPYPISHATDQQLEEALDKLDKTLQPLLADIGKVEKILHRKKLEAKEFVVMLHNAKVEISRRKARIARKEREEKRAKEEELRRRVEAEVRARMLVESIEKKVTPEGRKFRD